MVQTNLFETIRSTGVCRNCRILLNEMQKESELLTKMKLNDEELPKLERLSLEETKTSVSPSWSFSLCNVNAKDVFPLLKETVENFSNEGKKHDAAQLQNFAQ